tara:strand:- start:797 stop:985 length:189 start_codon:yes stop_codon:yes gene_type:complete
MSRIKEIKEILDNDFGADSTERAEDLIDELETLVCPLCGDIQTELYSPYCSVDCQTTDNLLC